MASSSKKEVAIEQELATNPVALWAFIHVAHQLDEALIAESLATIMANKKEAIRTCLYCAAAEIEGTRM